jgi:hypothetical protein
MSDIKPPLGHAPKHIAYDGYAGDSARKCYAEDSTGTRQFRSQCLSNGSTNFGASANNRTTSIK